jgi:hypothetical protein
MATTRTLECGTSKDADGNKLDEKREAEFTVDYPESVEEAVQMYDEDTVFSLFQRSFDIKANSTARGMLKRGFSEEEIQEEMEDWRPDETRQRRSAPSKSLEDQFSDLDADKQREMLQKLAQKAEEKRSQSQQAETSAPTA